MPKVKAEDVARELRVLADALAKEPGLQLEQPFISIYPDTREEFLGLVKVFPRPFYKRPDDNTYIISNVPIGANGLLKYSAVATDLSVRIERKKICRLVKPAEPAVYDCAPLFSEEEEAELNAGALG